MSEIMGTKCSQNLDVMSHSNLLSLVKNISVVDQYTLGKYLIMRKRNFGFSNFFMPENPKNWSKKGWN